MSRNPLLLYLNVSTVALSAFVFLLSAFAWPKIWFIIFVYVIFTFLPPILILRWLLVKQITVCPVCRNIVPEGFKPVDQRFAPLFYKCDGCGTRFHFFRPRLRTLLLSALAAVGLIMANLVGAGGHGFPFRFTRGLKDYSYLYAILLDLLFGIFVLACVMIGLERRAARRSKTPA